MTMARPDGPGSHPSDQTASRSGGKAVSIPRAGGSALSRLTEAFWAHEWSGMCPAARAHAKNQMAAAIRRSGVIVWPPQGIEAEGQDPQGLGAKHESRKANHD